jgi:hypothetical protein
MFDSVTYVTEDTKLTLTEDQVFYGIPRTGDVVIDTIGEVLLDRFIKAGLAGGEFAKVFSIMNKAMYQSDIVNPKAANSYKALQLFHKLVDYAKADGFKQTTHIINKSNSKVKEIRDYYTANPNSLFIPVGPNEGGRIRTTGSIAFKLNENFNADVFLNECKTEFDIRRLLPVWGDFDEKSGTAEYQTAFTLAMSLGYTKEDLKAMADKPLEILDISNDALKKSQSKQYIGERTFGEVSKSISSNTKNYYLLTKKAYVDSALAFSNKFSERLSETLGTDTSKIEALKKFANRKSIIVLGN